MVYAVLQVVMEGPKMLPKWGWNLEVTETQEEELTKN
jgi:hypothetical protein